MLTDRLSGRVVASTNWPRQQERLIEAPCINPVLMCDSRIAENPKDFRGFVTASRRVTPEVVKSQTDLNDFSGVDGT